MASSLNAARLSSGVVVVNAREGQWRFLLLRAYRNWDFPKGLVEAGESPLDAALREVREETALDDLCFDWGFVYLDTGPYNKGKIARYHLARSRQVDITLPINPDLGMPEHHEARWADLSHALTMVSPRLVPVVHWASGIVGEVKA